jgi:hypothetical protein
MAPVSPSDTSRWQRHELHHRELPVSISNKRRWFRTTAI